MVKSPEYLDFDSAMQTFVTKMGPDAESETFTAEAQILDWIDTHLNKTTFSSYKDAETQWNAIKTESEAVITNNPDFFSDWDDKDWDELVIRAMIMKGL